DLLAADNLPGGTALRTNTLRTTRDALVAELEAAGAAARPSIWATEGVVVERNSAGLRELPAWRDGRFAFQSEASQLVTPLRRHPELRWRRQPADVPRLAALQRDLLAGVATFVRPGGVLVYAVCTLAREENADVVTALAASHPRFVVESVAAAPDPPPAATI